MSMSVVDINRATSQPMESSQHLGVQQFSVRSNGASIVSLVEEAGAAYLGKRHLGGKLTHGNTKQQKTRVEQKSRSQDSDSAQDGAQQTERPQAEPVSGIALETQADAENFDQTPDWISFDEYSEQLTWLNNARLAEICDTLIEQAQDVELLWELLQKQARDPASQYAILLYARKITTEVLSSSDHIERVGWVRVAAASRLSQLLNRVIPQFEAEHRTHLRAALNTSAVVEAFVDEPQGHTGGHLSDFYRDAVLDFASLGGLYALITERYGARQFNWATRFLNQALQADYGSVGPSLPKSRLGAIMNDLTQIRSLESVHLTASKLWNRLRSTYSGVTYQVSTLIKAILDVQSAKVSNVHLFECLLASLGLVDGASDPVHARQYEVNLLTGVSDILRSIPPKYFQDNSQKRAKLLKDLQQVLDNVIAEEADRENRRVNL